MNLYLYTATGERRMGGFCTTGSEGERLGVLVHKATRAIRGDVVEARVYDATGRVRAIVRKDSLSLYNQA